MAECIEREATIKRIQEVYCVGCNSYNGVRCRACGTGDAIDMIEDAPAADVAPVVHGHRVDNGGFYARCSQCDGVLPLCANYCPNCGAIMDGGDNGAAD